MANDPSYTLAPFQPDLTRTIAHFSLTRVPIVGQGHGPDSHRGVHQCQLTPLNARVSHTLEVANVSPANYLGPLARCYHASENGRRQQGHSPSKPLTRVEKALGCGSVIIALNARGAR